MDAPYGTIDPNSQHQRWSHWIFGVLDYNRKNPSVDECVQNARVYFKKLFGTMGRVKVAQQGDYYLFEVQVEGPPVHDPDFCTAVKRDFIENFMFKGFGYSSRLLKFVPTLLAGDKEDGTPPDQMLVMPQIKLTP